MSCLLLFLVCLFGCKGAGTQEDKRGGCDPDGDPICEAGAFVCAGDALRLCDACGTGYEGEALDCGAVGCGCAQGRSLPEPEDAGYFRFAATLGEGRPADATPMDALLSAARCRMNRRPFRCANGLDDDGDGLVDNDDRDCRGPLDKDEAALRDRIIDGAGLAPLLVAGGPTPPDRVLVSATRDADGYRERLAYLEHPALGFVEVRLLLPRASEGPVPVVLGLHGHGGDAGMFRDAQGADLARRGVAVAALSFKAMAFDPRETTLATALIRAGGALLGLRVAEALMVLRWLGTLPEVDAARVGLLGHSGGSMAGGRGARLHGLKALHLDHQDTYGWDGRRIHGDVAPLLQCSPDGVWVFEEINDTGTLGIPVRHGDHARWGRLEDAETDAVARFFLEAL